MNSSTKTVLATAILAGNIIVAPGSLGPQICVSRDTTAHRNNGQVSKVTISGLVAGTTAGLITIVDLASWANDGVASPDVIWTCEIPVVPAEVTYDFSVKGNAGPAFANGLGIMSDGTAVGTVSISWVS